MKIVHLADTHLGHSSYRKISPNGFNQREEDVIRAFSDAIDKIILEKPDLVLHSGDLFDTVRPTNRIVSIGIRELLRLYEKDIPLILISGNHETPKQLYKGSVFSILELLPLDKKIPGTEIKLFNIIYKDKLETFDLPEVLVHAIPQCTTDAIFRAELSKIKMDPKKKNILMLHAGVSGMKEFKHGESNELLVDYDWLGEMKFDYVALGHYHKYANVGHNAFFSGSTERMSFNEYGQEKGFLVVDISRKLAKTTLNEVWTRPMEEVSPIDATGKNSIDLLDEIEKAIEAIKPIGKIIRLNVHNIPQHIMNSLDTKKIRDVASNSVHFEPTYQTISEEGIINNINITSGGIREEFRLFLNAKGLQNDEIDDFMQLWTGEYDEIEKEEE